MAKREKQLLRSSREGVEAHLLNVERELHDRSNEQLRLQVERFRELEAQQIRDQEAERHRRATDKLRREVCSSCSFLAVAVSSCFSIAA